VIARHHEPAATLCEAGERGAILGAETIAGIGSEQSHLVELGRIDVPQHTIIAIGIGLTIASRHVSLWLSGLVGQPRGVLPQQRKAADVPVVYLV
jgi:hypothetical protein